MLHHNESPTLPYTFDEKEAAELGLKARLYSTWSRLNENTGNQHWVCNNVVYTLSRKDFDILMQSWNRSNPNVWLYCYR